MQMWPAAMLMTLVGKVIAADMVLVATTLRMARPIATVPTAMFVIIVITILQLILISMPIATTTAGMARID